MDNLTAKDRVKIACLSSLIERGVPVDRMPDVLESAVRSCKTAGLYDDIKKLIWGNLRWDNPWFWAPVVGATATTTLGGYQMGNQIRRVELGRIPSAEELELRDATEEYELAADEIRRRMMMNKKNKASKSKASVRRMF